MTRSLIFGALAGVVGLLSAGCGAGEDIEVVDPDGIDAACNPLGGSSCLLPWPSAAYLVEADTATGVRVDLPLAAMPANLEDIPIDPGPFNQFDGFPPSGAMLAMFPGGVSPDGLPSHLDPGASLAAESPTVVLDMDTGERLLHFAEIDANVPLADNQALIIRPLVRMRAGARYVVAIRNTVRSAGGGALPVPDAFARIVAGDGEAVDHPLMARLAPRYDAIFAALEADGIGRDELVLAWDFVTASDDMLTADLRSMRDQAMPLVGDDGANLSFVAQERAGDPALTLRSFVGTYTAPSFLSDGAVRESVLVRDADGAPAPNGQMDANFALVIPQCAQTAPLPIPVVVFGHGLFGTASDYLGDDLLQTIANQACVVVVGGDFIGLSAPDLTTVAGVAANLDRASQLTDKLAQSIINFIALEQIVRGPMAADPAMQLAGQPIIDPDRVFYLGGSLGGIMGNVFMAYDPGVTVGTLGVPGGAWGLLFERSLAWPALQALAQGAYRDDAVYQLLIALLAMRLEPYDPITTSHLVLTGGELLGVPAKQILMYEGLGDSLVNNLSTEMVARTMGLRVTGPSLPVPFGLTESTEPLTSGFTIYDQKRDPLPPGTNQPPPSDSGTHSGVNEEPAVLRQVVHFLFNREVIHTCEVGGAPAPCDCTTGACD